MAERRMLSHRITDSDAFLNLSAEAQALYMHINVDADDDGFNGRIQIAMFRAHATTENLEELLNLRFLLRFDSGVVVVKHYRMMNKMRRDRYKPTVYQDEYRQLFIKSNLSYTDHPGDGIFSAAVWQPNGNQMATSCNPKDNQGKDRKEKDRKEQFSSVEGSNDTPPTLAEVKKYADERGNKVDAEKFFDYYADKGWGKDWKAKYRYWEKTEKTEQSDSVKTYDISAFERMLDEKD